MGGAPALVVLKKGSLSLDDYIVGVAIVYVLLMIVPIVRLIIRLWNTM
jgi:hypothetical protein